MNQLLWIKKVQLLLWKLSRLLSLKIIMKRVRCIIIVSRNRGRLISWTEHLILLKWSSLVLHRAKVGLLMISIIYNSVLLCKVPWMLSLVISHWLDRGLIKIIKVQINWIIFRDWTLMKNWELFIMIILLMHLIIKIMRQVKSLGLLEFPKQMDLIKWSFNPIIVYSTIQDLYKLICPA